jgi:cysteine synthase
MLYAVTLAVLALSSSSVSGLTTNTLAIPVRKVPKQPVLEVVDKASRSKVHLIGVSHGAPASAALVKETIARVKPNVIVLELCDGRSFFSSRTRTHRLSK